jgi:polar amino acid transport system permease protein
VSEAVWTPSERELERRSVRRRDRTRGILVATTATVVLVAVLWWLITSSAGWPRFKATFLSWHDAKAAFPTVFRSFWKNVAMFLAAEPLILLIGIAVAVVRQTVAPWLLPVRAAAVIYTDLFRGVPTFLVVVICALGLPALRLTGIPTSAFWLTLIALVLCYGAYVAEVIRAGIETVHPSQLASAQALALSRTQTMRFVVLPQALRRVTPPLLNDFVSLQKDTALASAVGVFEGVFAAQDYGNYHFNFTPLLMVGIFFVVLTIPLARLTDWLGRRALIRERGR